MRHPFAGIIGLELADGAEGSRRAALKVMLAGAGTALVSGGALGPALAADDPKADGDRAASDHAAYLVVPRDFRSFRADRRQALGVLGDYYRGAPDSKNLRGKGGFLGWLTAEAAKKVAAANDVAEVLAVSADDKPGPGTRRANTRELRLLVVPGGWKTRPQAGSYSPTDKLIQEWAKRFAALKDVKFKAGENDGAVVVEIGVGEPPRELIAGLKEHPQLVTIEWKYAATTTATGEEGGVTTQAVGEEGGVTTKALGEEGGTTRALGEEGGPTTKALGEEGGSTERLGEEGGPTTMRLGEEGGTTTKALGEEGGGTTERVGEEGATTLALGEEGGRPKPRPTPKTDKD
jgi:hypothetical protein